jgi:tRNA (guanine-N7-)-methyltransferase
LVEIDRASPTYLEARKERLDTLRSAIEPLADRSTITLEIGSGHGHFLTAYAAAHPQEFCVGIDIILDRFRRSERKRTRAAASNLCFIRAEASEFLEVLPLRTRLARIFVLFPDPWPKRRHHKNRLIRPDFLSRLAKQTNARGELYFRTDDAPYFTAAKTVIAHHPDWEISHDASWPFELETVFQKRATSFQSLIARRRP